MLLCSKREELRRNNGRTYDFRNWKMPFRSAIEDLKTTTLKSISGLLGRLDYLAVLRNSGSYHHWGFSRTHGEPVAQQAMTEAHRATLSGILRTPLRRMVEDAEASSAQKGIQPPAYIHDLSSRALELLPPSPGPGSVHHFNAVLHALSCLVKPR
jgi:hypothetical protein